MSFSPNGRLLAACVVALVVWGRGVGAQVAPAVSDTATAATKTEPAKDPLGRGTPRGTVVGFITAARRADNARARQYLDTRLADDAAEQLAHQLFVVLDARLPARLAHVSDAPAGSLADPLLPNHELVGTIASAGGDVNVIVERVERKGGEPIWLFSPATLGAIPRLHEEVTHDFARAVPRVLIDTRIGGVRLFDWIAILLGLPVIYLATVLLNRLATPLAGMVWQRISPGSTLSGRDVLPTPARILLLAIASRWLLYTLPLSLIVRQWFYGLASLAGIAAAVWLLFLVTGEVERYLARHVTRTTTAAAISLLRVGRRIVDLIVLVVGLLAMLRHFGVDPTPVLAGLGVGGIAIALAAQKTLENVIAGASLIFDEAVRVGDFLKVGEVQGTVDYIGLRSIRIRTLDRTIVTVPNSQIANMSLETLSARDKFWFHHVIGLRYETSEPQLQTIIDGIQRLLRADAAVERESVRVRFLRLGAFSLDVDLFAYVFARDWTHFLEIQERLLFSVTTVVTNAGTQIAFPSQTMYVEGAPLPSRPVG